MSSTRLAARIRRRAAVATMTFASLVALAESDAQEVPRDTAVADTTAADTAAATDTIKPPLARAELPVPATIGAPYHWDRASLFAAGAQSLLELLDLVPGITTFRSGGLVSPKIAAYLGDAARTRVFLDGVEIASLNPRTGGVLDLSDVQLWSLEEVSIERGADEIRVHARTWRVDRTSTSTRTDVATGDQGTNLFRGFFGKRFRRGEALQLAGQQLGVSGSLAGGGDELAVLGRLGWAGERWSFDAYGTRSSLNRDPRRRLDDLGLVPRLEARRTDAYVRAAYGDPERGFWAQVLGAMNRFHERSPESAAPVDSADTARTTRQLVAATGFTRWGARISVTNRLTRSAGETQNALAARIAFDRGPLGVMLYTEQRSGDSSSVEEASAVLRPLPFVALSGAVARRHGGGDSRLTVRGEAGIRVGRVWATGGLVRQQDAMVPGLVVFDSTYGAVSIPDGTAMVGTIRGKFYRDLGVDLWAVRWQDSAFFRPRLQGRAELFLETRWLSRFPRGNFGVLGSIAYEGRSRTPFPVVSGNGAPMTTEMLAPQHMGVARIEIRLLDAVLFYQQRFGFFPRNPAYLPGYVFPAQLQLYGVRWQFWN